MEKVPRTRGGGISVDAYVDDLRKMAEEYRERNSSGECFEHIRKKHSSNRDLRALSGLTKGVKFYKVNLGGREAESILTNSAKLANIIEASNCRSAEDVVREMEKEAKGDDWEKDKRGFEQHILEADRVRVDWNVVAFEKDEVCRKYKSKNDWDQKCQCCQKE